MDIGKIIKEYRTLKRKGYDPINQKMFAEKVGITATHLSQIEKGVKKPSLYTLEKISEGLGIKLPILMAMSISEKDIPTSKWDHFYNVKPVLNGILTSLMDN